MFINAQYPDQIVLATIFGSLLGFSFRHLMKFCERNDLIDRQSYVAQYVSLALLTIGTSTMLGTDDLLAAFCCGTAFAWDGFFNRQTEESVFSSVIDLLFNVACFVYIGAWMPFADFDQAYLSISVWRLVVIAILVLLLRRLPIMMALYKFIPDVKTFREAVFSGHFGPMGVGELCSRLYAFSFANELVVGAVFISTLAVKYLPVAEPSPANQAQFLAATIQPIVAFMVLCSILIHGLSIPFFSLSRRVHSVSRTWSRHGAPDWTMHTRRVSRAEDIVINRDSEMERGELSIEKTISGSPEQTVLDSIRQTESPSPQMEMETEEMKDEQPPDGNGIVSEWQEGRDKIVEKQEGPGEDVNFNST
jgi:sodium/hydrogen antiporter